MVYFDTRTFLTISGRGRPLLDAIGGAFGMPQCMLNLLDDVLQLLPTSVLRAMRGSTREGADYADRAIKYCLSKLKFLDGIIEYDSSTGTFRLVSRSSRNGLDRDNGDSVLGWLGIVAGFAGRLYNNYTQIVENMNDIKECLESYRDQIQYVGGGNSAIQRRRRSMTQSQYSNLVLRRFELERKDIESAANFRRRALELIERIDRVIEQRQLDPSKEPVFVESLSSIVLSSNQFSGTEFLVQLPTGPGSVSSPGEQPVKELIRLAFGPPISKSGKFILSIDGLYFDSQTSGILPVVVDLSEKRSNLQRDLIWKLEADPNIGGRGTQISIKDTKKYINTILDDNIINESSYLKDHYEKDELLTNLVGQKNRRIFDVSSQIVELENSSGPAIVIENLKQVLLSENSHYQQKINKRKKQIELAVRLPLIYNINTNFTPGTVPVNDFSYLEGINFDLSINQQRRLTLNQSDVTGVVLPLRVNYVQQIEQGEKVSIDHLTINNVGGASIVSDGDSDQGPNLSLINLFTKDSLAALYNLLRFDISDTSSTSYKLKNSSPLATSQSVNGELFLNAQLVGKSESDVFDKGVGIARIDGIVKNSSGTPTLPSSIGSYIKLPPDSTFTDLLYRNEGATFEIWTHTPNLSASNFGFEENYGISGLYRLLLANENTGINGPVDTSSTILGIRRSNSPNVTRGLIFGFTRDRRLTKDFPPSNNSNDNQSSDACLVLAPTQSYDSSSVGFINKSYDISGICYNPANVWYNMKASVTSVVNGVSLSSCNNEFCQIALTFNPIDNLISMYCDGQLLTASSYNDVFGIDPRIDGGLNIPSLTLANSFEYNQTTMASVPVDQLKVGPKLDSYGTVKTTPWIIGGGYTDGMQTGNFMGGDYGGISSALKGYVGGVKFYTRPLSSNEILNNYNSSKNFFKNIDI